jgi:1-acyl-sn-glycerol-3-phosphate acyltransferase
MRLMFRLEAIGVENIPAHGPVLLVANHSSVLDPPLIGGASDRQLTYLAKAELFKIPLFGALIHGLNARPVRREGADAGALRTAKRVLEEGGALLVFPEGTRGEEGVIRPAKPGAGLLAVSCGAAVVPVYVSGSGRAWPKGRRLPRPVRGRPGSGSEGPVRDCEPRDDGRHFAAPERYHGRHRSGPAGVGSSRRRFGQIK